MDTYSVEYGCHWCGYEFTKEIPIDKNSPEVILCERCQHRTAKIATILTHIHLNRDKSNG